MSTTYNKVKIDQKCSYYEIWQSKNEFLASKVQYTVYDLKNWCLSFDFLLNIEEELKKKTIKKKYILTGTKLSCFSKLCEKMYFYI